MVYRLGVVGADATKWKDISKPRQAIYSILDHAVNGALIDSEGDIVSRFEGEAILVSGHCPKGGVDIWAEEIADNLGIKKEIYAPEVNRWADLTCTWTCSVPLSEEDMWSKGFLFYPHTHKGYKSRNIQIAKASDTLYVISPKCDHTTITCSTCRGSGRVWNGGEFTGNYVEKLGKKVVRVVI